MNDAIYAQALYDLVALKKIVEPAFLEEVSISFYKKIKFVGLDETVIYYEDCNKKTVILKGKEIPEEMRVVLAFMKTIMARWEGGNSLERLGVHYGLSTSMRNLLPVELYESQSAHSGLRYITVMEFMKILTSK